MKITEAFSNQQKFFDDATKRIEEHYKARGYNPRAKEWEPTRLGAEFKVGWLMTFVEPKGDQETVWLNPECDQYNVINWVDFECLDLP